MSKLADVLQTENEDEQAKLVEGLIGLAQAEVTVLTITIDPRKKPEEGMVHLMCSQNIGVEQAYIILEKARSELLRMERAGLAQERQRMQEQAQAVQVLDMTPAE